MEKESSTYPISRQVSRREAMEVMERGERIGRRRARVKRAKALAERTKAREQDRTYTYPLDRQIGQRRGSIGRQFMGVARLGGKRLTRVS